MQSSYSIELNVFGSKVRYKPWHLSEGGVYDCICTASCGYYLRVAINWYITVYTHTHIHTYVYTIDKVNTEI